MAGEKIGTTIVCPRCGQSAWIIHEHQAGSPLVLECSVCGETIGFNVVGSVPDGLE